MGIRLADPLMPNDVRRYDGPLPEMKRAEDGDFVLSDDYDALAKRLARYDALAAEAARIRAADIEDAESVAGYMQRLTDDTKRLVDKLAELAPRTTDG